MKTSPRVSPPSFIRKKSALALKLKARHTFIAAIESLKVTPEVKQRADELVKVARKAKDAPFLHKYKAPAIA